LAVERRVGDRVQMYDDGVHPRGHGTQSFYTAPLISIQSL
jgi:hypothetical protein